MISVGFAAIKWALSALEARHRRRTLTFSTRFTLAPLSTRRLLGSERTAECTCLFFYLINSSKSANIAFASLSTKDAIAIWAKLNRPMTESRTSRSHSVFSLRVFLNCRKTGITSSRFFVIHSRTLRHSTEGSFAGYLSARKDVGAITKVDYFSVRRGAEGATRKTRRTLFS